MAGNHEIHVLNQETINQIAAGEVIERPSSVVKELLENAIDAGAGAVTVEIKDGGISFIRITDNGCGIPASEIRKAFLRHATSKITSSEDLSSVQSLGFRGEALSSIAAVAQVELITKTEEELIGTDYRIEGGDEISMEEIGAPTGTTFLVKNLFYHTPVRKKFLKTAQTEGTYVSELVERIALSHPEVSIRLIVNGQTKISTKGNDNLKDLIYAVFGRDIASNLLEINHSNDYVKLTGYIGKPVITRGNRSMENYFVNGRYVKSKLISKAIEDAYKSFLMQHRYPFTVLHFEIEPKILDVNVHPTKMELRIANENELYRFVYYTIQNALSGREYIPEANFGSDKSVKNEMKSLSDKPVKEAEPFEQQRRAVELITKYGVNAEHATKPAATPARTCFKAEKDYGTSSDTDTVSVLRETSPVYGDMDKQQDFSRSTVTADDSHEEPVFPEPAMVHQPSLAEQKVICEEARKHYQLIGQVFRTYWIFEYDKKMYIMDQHAAHEKVLFERNMKAFRDKNMYSQMLCPQKIVTLSDRQILALEKLQPALKQFGYEINEFGGHEYAVSEIPASLPDLDVYAFLTELLDSVSADVTTLSVSQDLYDKIATMSCKAAVKGNQKLSIAEANALLDELMTLDNPYMCPHGRPTIISFTQTELERKFKRIV